MARFYAQICTLILLIAVVGGFFLGNAVATPGGEAGGNLGTVTLHMTWVRDALDVLLLVVFAYVGFVASRHLGRLVTGAVGVVLLALAVLGFVVGDDAGATKGLLGMHFPVALNIFDLVIGGLAVLAALGTIEEEEPAPARR